MPLAKLYDLIRYLEYGTKLHIGVSFFGNVGGEAFKLPHGHTIHDSAVCWRFKKDERGARRCFCCRQAAIRKAQIEKKPFGGYCINGIYEYTHPVIIDGKCAAIIYVGNILLPQSDHRRLLSALGKDTALTDTMEKGFNEEECRRLTLLIEGYILELLRQAPSTREKSTSALIENVKNYLRSNLEYNVSLSNAASVFHYNAQYLGRRFKKETGMTFSAFLNNERLEKAASDLKNGQKILDISSGRGFNNVTYFNRLFKQRFGCSPTEYLEKKGK